MSGITPILDTLLHQVLGKRVDIPLAQELPEPVRPTSPGGAVSALHSDSRLEPRTPAPATLVESGVQTQAGKTPATPLPGAAPEHSTRTHFSGAARTIADLLVRYPAPSTAIRPPAPLLPRADSGDTARLAQSLQASVDRSGLFYESHLEQWFRGEFDGRRLALEPQMQLTRAQPAPIPPESPADVAERAVSDAEQPAAAPPTRQVADTAAGERLHSVLRHQLELLANPVLRWEGEPWPGMATVLAIHVPAPQPQRDYPDGGADGGEPQGDEADSWNARLRLGLGGLGEIEVQLGLRGEQLSLALGAASVEAATRLGEAVDDLRTRLLDVGVRVSSLTVEAPE